MAKSNGVSSKTHTQQQLNDYANQNNPNNKAYKAKADNEQKTKNFSRSQDAKKQAKLFNKLGLNVDLDWMCYSNPYDFD